MIPVAHGMTPELLCSYVGLLIGAVTMSYIIFLVLFSLSVLIFRLVFKKSSGKEVQHEEE